MKTLLRFTNLLPQEATNLSKTSVLLGWNGLVDGYPCYHRECDTMDTMIDYMGTDDSTGINNLVHSQDIVTWWAVYAFLHGPDACSKHCE